MGSTRRTHRQGWSCLSRSPGTRRRVWWAAALGGLALVAACGPGDGAPAGPEVQAASMELISDPTTPAPDPTAPCRERLFVPGAVPDEERPLARCALNRGPRLLSTAPVPPAPRVGRRARGSLSVAVDPDGRVNAELTRHRTLGPDGAFNEALRETVLQWRFEPGESDGRPVLAGFELQVESGPRPSDTLPARLEWSYHAGWGADTLRGRWVEQPPLPAFGRDLELEMLGAAFETLVAQGALRLELASAYCLVGEAPRDPVEGPDPVRERLGLALRDPGSGRPPSLPRAGPGCEGEAGNLRVRVHGIYRIGTAHAALHLSGDHLEVWPPGPDGRTRPGWRSRCVAVLPPAEKAAEADVEAHCDLSAVRLRMGLLERGAIQNPFPVPPYLGELPYVDPDPLFAAVVGGAEAATVDTLSAEPLPVPRLAEGAVREDRRRCRGWAAYSPLVQEDSLFVVRLHLAEGPDDQDRALLTRVQPRGAERFPGSRCEGGEGGVVWAFLLGDLEGPAPGPVTFCYGEPGCGQGVVLDPSQKTLAERPHLVVRPSDLRPSSRAGHLHLRLFSNRPMDDLLVLGVARHLHTQQRTAILLDRVGWTEWRIPLAVPVLHGEDPELRLYVMRR